MKSKPGNKKCQWELLMNEEHSGKPLNVFEQGKDSGLQKVLAGSSRGPSGAMEGA